MSKAKIKGYTSVFRLSQANDAEKRPKTAVPPSPNGGPERNAHTRQQDKAVPSPASTRSRARPVVSCLLCRTRKQKCDRQLPCGTCTRRGHAELCEYRERRGEHGMRVSKDHHRLHHGDADMDVDVDVDDVMDEDDPSQSPGQRQHKVPELEAQLRLLQLEHLVHGMMDRSSVVAAAEARAKKRTSPASQASRRQRRIPSQEPFMSVQEWGAVLDGIRDVQSRLGGEPDKEREEEEARPSSMVTAATAAPVLAAVNPEPDMLFTAQHLQPTGRPFTLADAVAELPPRHECDRLLAIYFQSGFTRSPLIHRVQFQRVYTRFWEARAGNALTADAFGCSGSPFLWLSILASTLFCAALVLGTQPDSLKPTLSTGQGEDGELAKSKDIMSSGNLALARRLQRLSTRCLQAGDYLSAPPLSVEALILNASTRLLQRQDTDPALWGAFQVATRLAQRQGYQQVDARRADRGRPGGGRGSRRGALTPFEMEMRRRVWYLVEMYDSLCSYQTGVPAIVHEDETATDLPHNLHDEDFDEFCEVLPPPRPLTTTTDGLYYACKLSMIRTLRRVVRFSGKAEQFSDDRLAAEAEADEKLYSKAAYDDLEAAVHHSHKHLPADLRMRDPVYHGHPQTQGADIIHRLMLELLHHQSICLLSRHAFCSRSLGSQRLTESERARRKHICLVSALHMLDVHAGLCGEQNRRIRKGIPGDSRLATEWQMFGSLMLHIYMLAAVILCVDLISQKPPFPPPPSLPFPIVPVYTLEQRAADRASKLSTLRSSYTLWYDDRLTSRDAAHVTRLLRPIIKTLTETNEAAEKANRQGTEPDSMETDRSTPPAPTENFNQAQWPAGITYDWMEPGPFDSVLSDPHNVDWYTVDSYLMDRQQSDTDAGGLVWSADLIVRES